MDESFARAALYIRAPQALMDHFFLGSGLASYATYSSGIIGYSLLYKEYNLDEVWGLLEGDCPFVSDTYFPELVQFGMVGIVETNRYEIISCKLYCSFIFGYGYIRN